MSANHYVDKKRLYHNLLTWKQAVLEAEEKGLERPKLPNSIGRDILLIAENIGKKHNYSQYPFLEEMIMDGVENCIRYIDNFNPFEYNNPYGYFTQIIHFAFSRRIQKEKKQLYTKLKVTQRAAINDELSTTNADGDSTPLAYGETSDKMNDFIRGFEDWVERNKVKRKEAKEKREANERD